MAKSQELFMCNNCGNEFSKWAGKCPACGEWNSMTQVTSFTRGNPTTKGKKTSLTPITAISPLNAVRDASAHAFTTTIGELDRVLGPGLTVGGVYLIAGQPGIGKSTLLTQLAIELQFPLLYVCSEENPSQVATRINRLSKTQTDHINLLNTSSVDQVIDYIGKHPELKLVIVDSIQSVYLEGNPSTPGALTQVRDSANLLIQTAKETNIPIVLVGHVTKEGSLAGPKLLEHMVDAVLELSGDKQTNLRILRSIKNRFGPTDEAGIFSMTGAGLEEVKDPSKFLLEDRLGSAPGSALTMIMEGTRPMTIEIQALVTPTTIPVPRRVAKGINSSRLQLICAILTKHLNLKLGDKDVFVNVTGGINVNEPGADLGIALAIISSAKNIALPEQSVCFGELGLLGEIRKVTFQEKREKEANKLGYTKILSPTQYKHIKTIKL